jgi:retinol dehydrogenase-12
MKQGKQFHSDLETRYPVSKLLELLFVRELADLSSKSEKGHKIIISFPNPGGVKTDILRNPGLFLKVLSSVTKTLFCRTAEEGARTLIHAAEGAEETHGQHLDDCKVGA